MPKEDTNGCRHTDKHKNDTETRRHTHRKTQAGTNRHRQTDRLRQASKHARKHTYTEDRHARLRPRRTEADTVLGEQGSAPSSTSKITPDYPNGTISSNDAMAFL